ncbi:Zn-dependent hydrolase [Rhodovarius crocodyli]|uniref:Zn-dependent hydrolase n=1 Tax=Rhodovarius crocodyli TaxID=1979269 RepID=A0A437MIY4_9PROT|nr:Zn-dependent hydrolase [Rhodovarius crocodyli]RVT97602.1 Zn-dependent hydrolase [Rhodovarius crocodyli]
MIDTAAFLADLDTLRKIGEYKTGVHRPTFSPQDMESRHWLAARMAEVGLEPTIDGIGNVFGRHTGPGPHVLAGSHIESQNYAGWLDGALGVISALALARAGLPVDVCAYCDEEWHFGAGFIGSRSLIGRLSEEEIDASVGTFTGQPLREALEQAGLAGKPRIVIDPARYKGAFEMHIEQGTQLENAGLRVGVVTGIVGIRNYVIEVEGKQDHTGGTTMAERKDALVGAMRILHAIDMEFPRVCGERSVWTAGKLVLDPNAPHIIPGHATINFSFRDIDNAVMDRMAAALERIVQEHNRRDRCPATLQLTARSEPALSDPAMLAALTSAAGELAPGAWQAMPSGAIHDSQHLARVMPVAMLFTPSIGGISHHWTEDTKREDLELGMRVLHEGVSRFLAA